MVRLRASDYKFADPANDKLGQINEAVDRVRTNRIQDAQLAMARARAQRDEDEYRRAVEEATQQKQAQAEAGSLIGSIGPMRPAVPNLNLTNQEIRQGQWQELQRQQADVMKRAGDIAGRLSPQFAERFRNETRIALADQAMILHRAQTGSAIHDGLVSGQYDPPDPMTGQRIPEEGIRAKVAEIGQRVQSGELDPDQALAMLAPIEEDNRKRHVEITRRKTTAQAARAKLTERMATGQPVSAWALAAIDDLDTREGAMKEWGEIAPYVLSGMVPNPTGSGYVTEEHADRLIQQLEFKNAVQAATAAKLMDQPALEREKLASNERRTLGTLESRAADRASREKIAGEGIKFRREALTASLDRDKALAEYRGAQLAQAKNEADQKRISDATEKAQADPRFRNVEDAAGVKALVDEYLGIQKPAKPADAAARARAYLEKK